MRARFGRSTAALGRWFRQAPTAESPEETGGDLPRNELFAAYEAGVSRQGSERREELIPGGLDLFECPLGERAAMVSGVVHRNDLVDPVVMSRRLRFGEYSFNVGIVGTQEYSNLGGGRVRAGYRLVSNEE